MTNILVAIIFNLCTNAGTSDKKIDCYEFYVNCIVIGKSEGSWTEKDVKRCIEKDKNHEL